MKKLIMTIALVAVAATSAMAQVSVGAGYLNSTQTNKYSNSSSKANLQGFYAGAGYQVKLDELLKGLTFTPGVYYNFLTGKSNLWDLSIASQDATTTEQYISVPVQIGYGINLTRDLKFYVYGAPTFNYGLASKTKVDTNTIIGNNSSTYDNYGENSNYTRFDMLIGAGAGIDFRNCLRLTGGYNYGLIDRNSSDDCASHRSEWHVGLAFLF